MSELPWIRFFPSDWLGGTRQMTAAEAGIYITLIATMYERQVPLEEDHSRLARACGSSRSVFAKALEALVRAGKIVRVPEGLWNGKVEKEIKFRREKSQAASQSAKSRWTGNSNEIKGDNDANAMRTQCEKDANQKPDSRYQKKEKDIALSNDLFGSQFEAWYGTYPRKRGKGQAERAYLAARKKTSEEILLAGAKRYAEECTGKDPKFIKHPSTWLNGECWGDAPEQATDLKTVRDELIVALMGGDSKVMIRNFDLTFGDNHERAIARIKECQKAPKPVPTLNNWLFQFGAPGCSVGSVEGAL